MSFLPLTHAHAHEIEAYAKGAPATQGPSLMDAEMDLDSETPDVANSA